ncbi:MAG: hypothetical protein H7832_04035 [Magnetococcus sp. DMHC-6]
MNQSHLVAHRGIPARFPDNSLAGVLAALQKGVRFVEFDLQLTADGVPVLFHDAHLKKATGRAARVADITWPELQKIFFRPQKKGAEERLYGITSLAEAVTEFKHYPHAIFFPEIKIAATRQRGVRPTTALILDLLDPIRSQCIPISFSIGVLKTIRTLWNAHPIGWIVDTWRIGNQRRAEALQPEYLFANQANFPIDFNLTVANWQWAFYEISDVELAKQWIARGAALIESNDVEKLAKQMAWDEKYPPPFSFNS